VAECAECVARPPAFGTAGDLNALEAPAWSRWAQNILGYFTGTPPVITLEDLVLAAADRPPATLFQRDLGRLGIRDWTNLCLHGARQAADFDPQVARPIYVTAAWGIIAGLRALHFSRELLTRLADELERAAPEAAGIMKTLAEGAPQSPPGALIVVDDPGFVDASGISARQPCLAVLRPQLTEHSNALTWLRAWDVYVIVYNESQADEPDETET